MKIEKLSEHQIKYSISFDEFDQSNLYDDPYWDEFIAAILEEACSIFQMDQCEKISIEIYSLTEQELILLLTKDHKEFDAKHSIVYSFVDIEDGISLAKRVRTTNVRNDLYNMDGYYYLLLDELADPIMRSICHEFGSKTKLTTHFLSEYGKPILTFDALNRLNHIFK